MRWLSWHCCGASTGIACASFIANLICVLRSAWENAHALLVILHDTMLQSFQGSVFEFQAVQKLLSNRPEEVKPALDRAIGSARSAIAEGRTPSKGCALNQGIRSALPICSERWGNNVWTLLP